MARASSYDFRRSRHKLHNYEFAYSPSRSKAPAALRVDKDTWNGIVHLPDDVSLRTSDYHGPELALASKNAYTWWDLLDESEGYPPDSPLRAYFIEGYSEPEASIFNALCGYYRQAGSSLRFTLEAVLAGMYFSTSPDTRAEFQQHQKGDPKVRMPYLGAIRDAIYAVPGIRKLNGWLGQTGQPECLNPDGCVRLLYNELTEFSHGRIAVQDSNGQLTAYSNVGMWESSGPIYRQDQFLRWYDLLCSSIFYCGALVRIFLLPSSTPDKTYLSGLRATMGLYLTDGATVRVSLIRQFLAEAFADQI